MENSLSANTTPRRLYVYKVWHLKKIDTAMIFKASCENEAILEFRKAYYEKTNIWAANVGINKISQLTK